MFSRKQAAVLVAEFLGTFALATAVLNTSRLGFAFFPAAMAGLTLATMVLVIGPFSGSHINPAVTLGFWSIRQVATKQALAFIVVQLLAGLSALKLNEYFLGYSLPELAKDGWQWPVVLAEGLGTMLFTFGIAAAVLSKYEGGRLAAAIGASLTVGVLIATMAANGALNPAVALGINSWSWGYVLAPLAGGIVGMNLYALLFAAPAKAKKR